MSIYWQSLQYHIAFLSKLCYYPYRDIWPPNTDRTWPAHTITDWIKIIDLSRRNNHAHDWAVIEVSPSQMVLGWQRDEQINAWGWRDGLLICSPGVITIWPRRGAVRTPSPTQDAVFGVDNGLLVLRTQGHKDAFITPEKNAVWQSPTVRPTGQSPGAHSFYVWCLFCLPVYFYI